MSELVPSVLFAAQSVKLIEEMIQTQNSSYNGSVDGLLESLYDVMAQFEDKMGQPLINFNPVVEGEPPSSSKANRFWNSTQKDVNLLQHQLDLLSAATYFAHNMVTTEVKRIQNDTARIKNKIKSLQLYTESPNSKTLVFGDNFSSFEFADTELIPENQRLAIYSAGKMTLAQRGDLVNLTSSASIRILPSSNGFVGNNQEVEDASVVEDNARNNPASFSVLYKSESSSARNDLATLTDDEPNTWFEYEQCAVSEENIINGEHNWEYKDVDSTGNETRVFWPAVPEDGNLNLSIEFDIKSVQACNLIEVRPHGLEGDKNYPFKVSAIHTSANGADWTPVNPRDVYVGTRVNLQAARTASDVSVNRAIWTFDTRYIRYFRVSMVQSNPIETMIGHTYWVDKDNESTRVEGPIPDVDNPGEYHRRIKDGRSVQKREAFPGLRWAIGIRDILLNQVEYKNYGVYVSKDLDVAGVVDRVVLEDADIEIPDSFDSALEWVKFYVSPDGGESWYRISRIKDPAYGIPEQIAFNDPVPAEIRDPGVAYYSVDKEVKSLKFKVEMGRPDDSASSTPILKSYTLKVLRR